MTTLMKRIQYGNVPEISIHVGLIWKQLLPFGLRKKLGKKQLLILLVNHRKLTCQGYQENQ